MQTQDKASQKVKIVTLAASATLTSQSIASPILADVALAYPGSNPNLIQMVLTFIALFCTIGGGVTGWLHNKFSARNLLLFALSAMIGAGLLSFAIGKISLVLLLVAACCFGFGLGLINSICPIYISAYFNGATRSRLMGLQCAMVNGGGLFIVFFSGLLAGWQWNYAYLIVLTFIPLLIFSGKNLPKESKTPPLPVAPQQRGNGKINFLLFYPPLALTLIGAAMHVYDTNISLYLFDFHLGNAATAGLLNCLYMVSGLLIGIFYGRIYSRLGNQMMPLATATGALAFFAAARWPSLTAAAFASLAAGFCQSASNPTAFFLASVSCPAAHRNMSLSLTAAASGIGMFLSPLIANPLANLLGGGQQQRFYAGMALMLFLTVSLWLANRKAAPYFRRYAAAQSETLAEAANPDI